MARAICPMSRRLNLFTKHRPSFMTHLILSHLSKNNNDPVIVKELFTKHAGKTQIVIASRDEESPCFKSMAISNRLSATDDRSRTTFIILILHRYLPK